VTTKPRLRLGKHLLPGLAAVALFGVMAGTILTASFGDPAGFGGPESITRNIGYAMFDLTGLLEVPTEGFLVAFMVTALVLDAALEGAVYLAKREAGDTLTTALSIGGEDDSVATDGGQQGGEN
jgi:NADH-quinone oxidoreductase subunit J